MNFSTQTYSQAYEDMKQYDGFFLTSFLDKVKNNPEDHLFKLTVPYTENSELDNETILKKVIGTDGYWLKLTSEKQDLEYLWYDTKNKNFLFWSQNKNNCERANGIIKSRIFKITEEEKANTQFNLL